MRERVRGRTPKGGVLAVVALWLACLLLSGPLLVDLRSLVQAWADAHHAAASAALAGSGAYLQCTAHARTVRSAKQRAMRSAASSSVLGHPVDTSTVENSGLFHRAAEVTVEVIPDQHRVRVWVRSNSAKLSFVPIMNALLASVWARATAQAADSRALCRDPKAEPDQRGLRWLVEE